MEKKKKKLILNMKVECAVQEQLHKWGGPMDSDNLTPLEQETSKRVWNNQE